MSDHIIFLDNGLPQSGAPGRGDPPVSAWDALTRGRTIGKSAVLQVQNAVTFNARSQKLPLFELRSSGDDRYALPLSVTVAPPLVLPANATVSPGQEQNASGFVSLAERLAAGGAALDIPNIFLNLTFGIGGAQFEVEVDALHGACVNVQASWVRAYMFYEDTGLITNAYYQVSAFVGPGKASTHARRSQFMGILANGIASTAFTVPKFARSLTLTGSNGVDVFVATVRFYRNIGCTDLVGEYLFAANSSNNLAVPVPNGGYFYKVTPAIDTPWVTACFDLAI